MKFISYLFIINTTMKKPFPNFSESFKIFIEENCLVVAVDDEYFFL